MFRYQNHQSVFVVTPAGVIATDPISYGRPQAARTYVDEIRKITKAPIKYLVYSHHHYDHIAGGAPFKEAGAKIIAHKRAKERLAKLKAPDVVLPDETVDGRRTIKLGGTTVELVYTGRNHSDLSLVMFLPKEKLIFAVDFNALGAVPSRLAINDSYPVEWEELLKRTLALGWERQIPGHPGPGGRLGTRQDMEQQLAFMTDLSAEVKKASDEGKCFDPATKEVRVPKYATLQAREAKRGDRQLGNRGSHSPGDDNALGSMPSHGPGCAGRVRDSRPSGYARPPQAPLEVIQKCLFSAEEMGRRSNVEPNAIRAVCRHKRAVAHAPGREPSEPFVIRLRGGFGHVKLGHERLRVSDGETSTKAERLRRLVSRYNDPARTDLRRHDERLLTRRRVSRVLSVAIGRPHRKEERDDPSHQGTPTTMSGVQRLCSGRARLTSAPDRSPAPEGGGTGQRKPANGLRRLWPRRQKRARSHSAIVAG